MGVPQAALDNRRSWTYTDGTHCHSRDGGLSVSIIRVGLAETKNFAQGYEAIFGKKKAKKEDKDESGAKAGTGKKKKAGKKKK
jgi:hypothetical protein